MEIPILFEDDNLLVIDKPCGISVTEEESTVGEDTGSRVTIKEWVRKRYNYKSCRNGKEDEFEQRFGIVHRLDKETSGVLLVTKTKMVFDYLKGLFKYRRIHKQYQALCYGIIPDDQFEISAPVGRNKGAGTAYSVEEDGREAITGFKVLVCYNPGNLESRINEAILNTSATYLDVRPKTGRTHQIRVHLKALGHPVVNDYKYASNQLLNLSEKVFDRMLLHAKSISFVDWDGKNRQFESPQNLSDLFLQPSSQK